MRILRARLLAAAQDEADAEASRRAAAPRSVPSTAPSGSAPTTTPENRITDHRVGYKAYNLDQVLDGDLQRGRRPCVEADLAARLAAVQPQG